MTLLAPFALSFQLLNFMESQIDNSKSRSLHHYKDRYSEAGEVVTLPEGSEANRVSALKRGN